ncbi:protein phosphatase 3 catalytic subunit alpha-like [Symsagittifera roscoffensis]|uniref:protein phosphatase 3 catalytic subunit alpha-like n=1 Tax=Symsagittifera roscoffensis TaxID=84072 RepID=UPI00307C1C5E
MSTNDKLEVTTGSKAKYNYSHPSLPQPAQNPLPRETLSSSDVFKKGFPDLGRLRGHLSKQGRLEVSCVLRIFKQAKKLLSREENVLELEQPVIMVGDIHGQFYDLLRLLDLGGPLGSLSPTNQYLFLGDYVDRGMFGMECIIVLCALKIAYPKKMHLLRGNHECRHLTRYFSFKVECLHKYNERVYNACMDMFDHLPLAAIVNNQFFCVHGGLSPRIQHIKDIQKIIRVKEPDKHGDAMTDLMWSDPTRNYGKEREGKVEHFSFNKLRRISFFYSYAAVCNFLKENDLLCVVRAHEAKDAGFQMFRKSPFSKFPSLISIFSAPNYCDTYGNKGVILCLADGQLNIKTFLDSPHPFCLPNFENGLTWSFPFAANMVTKLLFDICELCTEEELEADGVAHSEEAGRIRVLRNKMRAIGRMRRYYNMLSEKNGLIAQLKDLQLSDDKLYAKQKIKECVYKFMCKTYFKK